MVGKVNGYGIIPCPATILATLATLTQRAAIEVAKSSSPFLHTYPLLSAH